MERGVDKAVSKVAAPRGEVTDQSRAKGGGDPAICAQEKRESANEKGIVSLLLPLKRVSIQKIAHRESRGK